MRVMVGVGTTKVMRFWTRGVMLFQVSIWSLRENWGIHGCFLVMFKQALRQMGVFVIYYLSYHVQYTEFDVSMLLEVYCSEENRELISKTKPWLLFFRNLFLILRNKYDGL